jgi:hypothetical protein
MLLRKQNKRRKQRKQRKQKSANKQAQDHRHSAGGGVNPEFQSSTGGGVNCDCPVTYKKVLMSTNVEGWQAAMQLEMDLFDKLRVPEFRPLEDDPGPQHGGHEFTSEDTGHDENAPFERKWQAPNLDQDKIRTTIEGRDKCTKAQGESRFEKCKQVIMGSKTKFGNSSRYS